MVETRAQAMANERIDKIEEEVHSLHSTMEEIRKHLKGLDGVLRDTGKEPATEEAYKGHEYHEGESSHSPHVWHTHPPEL